MASGFWEGQESMTKVGLYAIGISTTLESNKSLLGIDRLPSTSGTPPHDASALCNTFEVWRTTPPRAPDHGTSHRGSCTAALAGAGVTGSTRRTVVPVPRVLVSARVP